jgi:hypothetical protein
MVERARNKTKRLDKELFPGLYSLAREHKLYLCVVNYFSMEKPYPTEIPDECCVHFGALLFLKLLCH